jgi:RNase H-fold protein (predicted Holliday junction resolvase)
MTTREQIALQLKILRSEIRGNQTKLVCELFEKQVFSYEDIQNPDTFPSWDKVVCGKSLYFQGGTYEQTQEFARIFEYLREAANKDFENDTIPQYEYDERITSIEEAEQEFFNVEAVSQQIYEWWFVSEWLAEELNRIGSPVLFNEYGLWWGRTTTGCALGAGDHLESLARKITSEGR